MKLENQVCTRQQAERLKELGISQKSLFSWFGSDTRRLMDNGPIEAVEYGPWLWIGTTQPGNNQEEQHRENVSCKMPLAAAWTVADLGIMLPHEYGTVADRLSRSGERVYPGFAYRDGEMRYILPGEHYKIEAHARAALLIYLLEINRITPTEVNARLEQNEKE